MPIPCLKTINTDSSGSVRINVFGACLAKVRWQGGCLCKNMLVAVSILAIGAFAAGVIRRLKLDTEEEKAFRAQLSGSVRLDERSPLLS
jgi:hypothetical protein